VFDVRGGGDHIDEFAKIRDPTELFEVSVDLETVGDGDDIEGQVLGFLFEDGFKDPLMAFEIEVFGFENAEDAVKQLAKQHDGTKDSAFGLDILGRDSALEFGERGFFVAGIGGVAASLHGRLLNKRTEKRRSMICAPKKEGKAQQITKSANSGQTKRKCLASIDGG